MTNPLQSAIIPFNQTNPPSVFQEEGDSIESLPVSIFGCLGTRQITTPTHKSMFHTFINPLLPKSEIERKKNLIDLPRIVITDHS